jgi:hypothetical protein
LRNFCRLVRGPQQVSGFPLNVIHDAAPIETAMQADGNESRLARHEASSVMIANASACFSGSASMMVI